MEEAEEPVWVIGAGGAEGPDGPAEPLLDEVLTPSVPVLVLMLEEGVAVAPLVTEGGGRTMLSMVEPGMMLTLMPGAADEMVGTKLNEIPPDALGVADPLGVAVALGVTDAVGRAGSPGVTDDEPMGRAELPVAVDEGAPMGGTPGPEEAAPEEAGPVEAEGLAPDLVARQIVLVQSTVSYRVRTTVVPGGQSWPLVQMVV